MEKNKKIALIVVDVQNDFCKNGSLAVQDAEAIIPLINQLMNSNQFALKVATLDWHPKKHKSFYTNHAGKKPFESIDLNGIDQVLWPEHCVQNTFGAMLHKDLNKNFDFLITKGMNPEVDSYSGFFDNNKKDGTGLLEILKNNQIDEVVVVGLAFDYCVKATCIDSQKLGFKTTVLTKMSKSVDFSQANYNKVKDELLSLNITVVE